MSRGIRVSEQEYQELLRRTGGKADPAPVVVEKVKRSKMSKTEELFERQELRDVPHKFQPFTFHMANGLKYRPDFYLPLDRIFIEVKGSYRLHSHGRSMLAFNQCRVEFPEFEWQLAVKNQHGGFDYK